MCLSTCQSTNGTLYVSVTSHLIKRIHQHRTDAGEGFTNKYRAHNWVWYEQHATMKAAILREKQIKKWKHTWKSGLIEAENARWCDLFGSIAT